MSDIIVENLNNLFNKIEDNNEFEIMFNNYKKENILNLHNFIDVLKYIKHRSLKDNLKLEINYTLDISYNYDKLTFNSYRITINDLDNINKLINGNENRNNSIIFSILASKINSQEKDIFIIDKVKDYKKRIDINEFDIRIRLSGENSLSKNKISELTKLKDVDKNISFRNKQRISLILEDNKNYKISIDLTEVKSSDNVKKVLIKDSIYEVEIDFFIKKSKETKLEKEKIIEKLSKEIYNIKKVIDNNFYLLDNANKLKVIDKYNNLLDNTKKNIYSMNVVSLQSENIVDNIINKYSLTDKADGEHFALMIYNDYVYLISSNLDVKFTNIKVSDKSYNNTILDGELIFVKNNKFLFAAFDILYYKNEDIRNIVSLEERISKLDDVIKNVLNKNFKVNPFNKNYNIENLLEYHDTEFDNYLDNIDNLVNNNDKYIFSRKYYMFTTGLSNNEIFKYCEVMWKKYSGGNNSKWPYKLDGLIFTPLNQKYTNKNSEIKNKIYKWKPPNDNTIDFYYVEVKDDNKKLNLYDNTDENPIKNKAYRIGKLHVGNIVNNIEKPILFREDEELFKCKFYLDDDNLLKDIEGNIIQDKTVIECFYNKENTDPESRWVPIRTRYDKTHNVRKYNKKYGNFKTVADNVWKSINENNTIDVIYNLANDELYNNTINSIKEKINLAETSRDKSKETYYKKKVDIAKNMRNFHNFIKSIIIYKYCFEKKVLDVGVGRGGDLMKFYHSRSKIVVGLDVDSYEIESATDGPKSRANTLRKKFPGFPPMFFGLGDGGVLFNLEDQNKIFNNISNNDKQLLLKNFGKDKNNLVKNKFDVFNCQFMIHFLFKSNFTLNNFCENIVKFLEKDGYLLITTLDGSKLHNLFQKNNGVIESYYTDDNENKKIFFRFKANYDYNSNDINKTGLNYESYLSWINDEDEYYTEYLVSNNFIIDSLKEKANMELIETCSFSELYNNFELLFNSGALNESEERTRIFFMKIKDFYSKSITHEQIFSFLNRMYIFKKN